MNRKQAWILFIVCFVVVCAFTILIVNAFDDIVAKQVKDDVTADWVGLIRNSAPFYVICDCIILIMTIL